MSTGLTPAELFETTFPELADIRLLVEYPDPGPYGKGGKRETMTVSKQSFQQRTPCPNPSCRHTLRSGVHLQRIISSAVYDQLTEIDESLFCEDRDRIGRECLTAFRVKGTLVYKTDKPPDQSPSSSQS